MHILQCTSSASSALKSGVRGDSSIAHVTSAAALQNAAYMQPQVGMA